MMMMMMLMMLIIAPVRSFPISRIFHDLVVSSHLASHNIMMFLFSRPSVADIAVAVMSIEGFELYFEFERSSEMTLPIVPSGEIELSCSWWRNPARAHIFPSQQSLLLLSLLLLFL
jgi:hypothetical protein